MTTKKRKTVKPKPIKVEEEVIVLESPSSDKRIDEIEASQLRQTKAMEDLAEMVKGLVAKENKLPTVTKPLDRIAELRAAEKAALPDGEAVSRRHSVDLRSPRAAESGFQPNDVIRLKETSPKYNSYKLNADGEPVKRYYIYRCGPCKFQEKLLGESALSSCPTCGGKLNKAPAEHLEDGTPALGVVLQYMYTKRKGGRKYKVNFPDFGSAKAPEGGNDGITESEMELVSV